jgi:hypothetical protein
LILFLFDKKRGKKYFNFQPYLSKVSKILFLFDKKGSHQKLMLIKNHNFDQKLLLAFSNNGITNPTGFWGVLRDEGRDRGGPGKCLGIKERTEGLRNFNP